MSYDVIVGEPLLEFSATQPLSEATSFELSFSGDAADRSAGRRDALLDAVRLGMAAASLSLGGKGGTGPIPTLEQTRAHAAHGSGQE